MSFQRATNPLGNGNLTAVQNSSNMAPSTNVQHNSNLAPGPIVEEPTTPSSVAPSLTGSVTVDFETREGSAKPGKDFRFTQGTLVSLVEKGSKPLHFTGYN